MRLFLYVIWMILIIIGASFAILNSHTVPIDYIVGQKTIYFPLLILLLLFIGIVIGILAMLPIIVKLKLRQR